MYEIHAADVRKRVRCAERLKNQEPLCRLGCFEEGSRSVRGIAVRQMTIIDPAAPTCCG
jgi:hypothetical protein